MKNYFLVVLSIAFVSLTASDRKRNQLDLPSVEVPSHINIKYYKTHEDATYNINPHYIKIPITQHMYLADIEEELVKKFGPGKLETGMPLSQGQMKAFTIAQFWGPRKSAGMAFEDMEQAFVFWPNKRNLR